jgi:hypothetical protein
MMTPSKIMTRRRHAIAGQQPCAGPSSYSGTSSIQLRMSSAVSVSATSG